MQAWLADWRMADDGVARGVEDAPIVPFSPDEACVLRAGAGQPWLMIAVARDEVVRLGNWLAGIRESVSTLSQEVGRAALEDLAHRLVQLMGKGDVAEHGESAWPRNLTREELGATGLTLHAGGVAINLALSRDAVDAVCPSPPPVPGPALHARADAAGTASTQLTAIFDFGTISIRELGELRVGEVLVGECPLDTPVHVRSPGKVPIATARMGRNGNRLAIAITQYPTLQENA